MQGLPEVLHQTIQNLPLSEAFKTMATINKFNTIIDVLDLHLAELLKKEGFNPRVYLELSEFLAEHHLSEQLKQR